MAKNKGMIKARKAKKDEFYTQLNDIASELSHYKPHFEGKTVFCNCDDPFESNFFRHFVLSFNKLGLKKLITTSYSKTNAQKAIITKVNDQITNIKDVFNIEGNKLEKLDEDGDFRSKECLELLDESDIVCTNPPFSLFREYVTTLMNHNKKFIIIGHQGAIGYKEIFPLIKDNKMWLGFGFPGNVGFFASPYKDVAVSSQHKDGLIRVSGVMWFTNLDIKKRHEDYVFVRKYDPDQYPKYDNYNAINVGKSHIVPENYDGVMGVPITFMEKYNPDQFELLGITNGNCDFDERAWPTKKYIKPIQINKDGSTTNGSKVNTGAAILLDNAPLDEIYYTAENVDKPLKIVYARILIRNKNPK